MEKSYYFISVICWEPCCIFKRLGSCAFTQLVTLRTLLLGTHEVKKPSTNEHLLDILIDSSVTTPSLKI